MKRIAAEFLWHCYHTLLEAFFSLHTLFSWPHFYKSLLQDPLPRGGSGSSTWCHDSLGKGTATKPCASSASEHLFPTCLMSLSQYLGCFSSRFPPLTCEGVTTAVLSPAVNMGARVHNGTL